MLLCAAFLGLRWRQLAVRAPDDVERLQLAPVLTASAGEALPGASAHADAGSPQSAKPAGKVDINTASAAELATLPGIGEVLAGRIADYRAEHGPFKSLDGLLEVEGIGEGKLAKLKPEATAGK